MFEKVAISVASQVPGLIVLTYLVERFLRHLREKRVLDQKTADDCHTVIRDTADIIRENSRAMGEVKEAMRMVREVVRDCHSRGPAQ